MSACNAIINPFPSSMIHAMEAIEEPFIEPPECSNDLKEMQEIFEKRIIHEDFERCGIFSEASITADELVYKLSKSCRSYDEKMIRQIHASLTSFESCCDSNFINGRQFINAYMKRKRELSRMLDLCSREIEAAEKTIYQAEANLNKNNNVGEESKLTVQIVSLQNLEDIDEENNCMYKIHLECQQQAIETRVSYINEGIIYFNEMFSFEIGPFKSDLMIRFIQVDPHIGREMVLGVSSVIIDSLADQRKHEMTKELWGIKGDILMSCQWIYSKKLLYQKYMQEFAFKREQKFREMCEYQIEFDKLNMPFILSSVQEDSWYGILVPISEKISKMIDNLISNLKITNMNVLSQYTVVITFFLTFIAGFSRTLFLDELVAAFAFWCNLDDGRWNVSRYNILICAIILSIFLDFFWIKVYFSAWTLGSAESDLHSISKIFSIILLLWKVLFVVLFWKFQFDLKRRIEYSEKLDVSNYAFLMARKEMGERDRIESIERRTYLSRQNDMSKTLLLQQPIVLSNNLAEQSNFSSNAPHAVF